MVKDAILIDEKDNIATTLRDPPSNAEITIAVKNEDVRIGPTQPIPFVHKFAVTRIAAGGCLLKHCEAIGVATQEIRSGEHAHIHNVKNIREGTPPALKNKLIAQYRGFKRLDGGFGTRSYLTVLPSVGCANEVAQAITKPIKNAVPFLHHQGCCQLKSDIEVIERTLIGIGENSNSAAVLLISLGCETVDADKIADTIAKSGKPVEVIRVQKQGGFRRSVRKGRTIAQKMARGLSRSIRTSTDIETLTVGLKCGASDATSGLASNPAVGKVVDRLIEAGATVIIGETTEFIGAEHLFAQRIRDEKVKSDFLRMVRQMEQEIKASGLDMRGSQPTRGNIAGGITTIEEKSLGAIIKGGTSPVKGVLDYSESPSGKGLFVMDTPGFEPYHLAGLSAGGANVIIFSTGLGAPQGFPIVPVIKVSGNPKTCRCMREHIDICVGDVIAGKETLEKAGERILKRVIETASGKRTRSEVLGYDQTSDIYTRGPTI